MKIFFYSLREFDELAYCKEFTGKTGIEFGWTGEYPNMDNAALAAGADAISSTPSAMPCALLKKFRDLGVKYIATRSIGYDHIDLNTAHELGFRVSNVGYTPNGVANYAIMLIMMCLRKVRQIYDRSLIQDYSLKGKLGKDISSCTVGVIGTGRIGTTVIQHLSGFGCKILAYDLYPNETVKKYAAYVPLDELLAKSDAITLHANANATNYHLINAETLAEMKDGAVIVNTARGKLIDEKALIQAVRSGKIGAAGLDVMEDENGLYYGSHVGEPLNKETFAVLRSFPNVLLLPHTAFYTDEDVRSMVEGIYESVQLFASGRDNPHEIR